MCLGVVLFVCLGVDLGRLRLGVGFGLSKGRIIRMIIFSKFSSCRCWKDDSWHYIYQSKTWFNNHSRPFTEVFFSFLFANERLKSCK